MDNQLDARDNLELGRGKRPKLNNQTVSMRMSSLTKQGLECIADSYKITYGNKPWIAGLLEKIGSGELMVVPTPPLIQDERLEPSQMVDIKESVKAKLQKRYGSSALERAHNCSKKDDTDATSGTGLQSRPTLSGIPN